MLENNKELFDFADGDELKDSEKIKTKSISYMQDALIRFKKNRLNVVATYILTSLILLSFIVPMVSTKPYSTDIQGHDDANLKFLTPRVQILENFGILDGTVLYKEKPLSLDTGHPLGESIEFITGDLDKYNISCNSSTRECIGGTIEYNYTSEDLNQYGFALRTIEKIDLSSYDQIEIKLGEITKDLKIVFFADDLNNDLKIITSNDSNKTIKIDVNTKNDEIHFGYAIQSSSYYNGIKFSINEINFNNTFSGETTTMSGSQLMRKVQATNEVQNEAGEMEFLDNLAGGSISRVNSQMLVADYRVDTYAKAFSTKSKNIDQTEYDELSNGCEVIGTDISDEGNTIYLYNEECTLSKVEETSCIAMPGGNMACSYNAELNYLQYKNLDSIPYYWFGTDAKGHDLFTKIFKGLNSSLLFGLLAAMINITIGIVYGAVSGYYGGKIDLSLQRITELIGGVPFLVVMTIANLYLGQGLHTVVIVVCLTGWIGISRTTRAQFYRYKGREYVLASRSLGASDKRLIFRHILPNGIGIIVTSGVLMIPGMITLESTLSYLNLGLSGDYSLGLILSNGQAAGVSQFPHLTLFPTMIICLLMITFNLFGMALRDALNPSLRGTE